MRVYKPRPQTFLTRAAHCIKMTEIPTVYACIGDCFVASICRTFVGDLSVKFIDQIPKLILVCTWRSDVLMGAVHSRH